MTLGYPIQELASQTQIIVIMSLVLLDKLKQSIVRNQLCKHPPVGNDTSSETKKLTNTILKTWNYVPKRKVMIKPWAGRTTYGQASQISWVCYCLTSVLQKLNKQVFSQDLQKLSKTLRLGIWEYVVCLVLGHSIKLTGRKFSIGSKNIKDTEGANCETGVRVEVRTGHEASLNQQGSKVDSLALAI